MFNTGSDGPSENSFRKSLAESLSIDELWHHKGPSDFAQQPGSDLLTLPE